METVRNSALRETYLNKLDLRAYFSQDVPDFMLLRYAPGELITTPFSPTPYLQFVASGELLLYEMSDEENAFTIQTTNNDIAILGDMELIDAQFTPFFVEARSEVYTLALSLERCRQQLIRDPVFLLHLCRNLAEKLNGAVAVSSRVPLRIKVIRSLRRMEPGQRFSNIAHLAKTVNVSSRQLLRVLKEMCDEGVLEHESKGQYRLIKKP